MKVSISSWNYRVLLQEGRMDLLGFVADVKRLGADGLEIFGPHLDPADAGGHLEKVVDKARSLGLDISSLIAANDFALPAAADRAEQVEHMKAWIGHAAAVGIGRLNTFTGHHTAGQDPFMEAWRVIDAYREVMPLAEQHDLLLCIENHSGVCRDADGLLWLIRQVGSDNLKTNPDVTNFVPEFPRRGERAMEAVYTETQKLMPLAANVHLKVGDFTAEGEHAYVDVPRLIAIFRDAGYDGHIVLEAYGDNDHIQSCVRGLAMMRKCL